MKRVYRKDPARQLRNRLLATVSALLLAGPAMAEEPVVFGWVEKSTLEPWGVEVKAKLDSGALT
ncbi:MAG: ATP-dependent zinc protease, partial [Billgrantia desiderata]